VIWSVGAAFTTTVRVALADLPLESTTVAVRHLGEKAAVQCKDLGITVYCGASGSVADVLEQLRTGQLSPPSKENYCKHHH
jgi:predicted Fe-Mo cluster-binding NifX family protein